jgi:hypothetical protein
MKLNRTPLLLIFKAVLFLLGAGITGAGEFYAAPDGNGDGTGTRESPWDLESVLTRSVPVNPGDTVWLMEGTYRVNRTIYARLNGEPANPIVVRGEPGKRVTLDMEYQGAVYIQGSYTWYWGFEVMSSAEDRDAPAQDTRRVNRGQNLYVGSDKEIPAPGIKLINLVTHDTDSAVGLWAGALDAELYGCLIYYNGYDAPDRKHGHALYTQNDRGTKKICENIMFGQFGYNIQAYGSGSTEVRNYIFEGNVLLGNSNILGGYAPASGMVFRNNFVWAPGREAVEFGFPEFRSNQDAVFTGNIITGDVRLNDWKSLEFTGNLLAGSSIMLAFELRHTRLPLPETYTVDRNRYHYLGRSSKPFLSLVQKKKIPWESQGIKMTFSGWQDRTGADLNSTYRNGPPGEPHVFVRPNKYEQGRGHIIIYNWTGLPEVPVDISPLGLKEGQVFEVRDAENYFGPPVYQGQYTDETVMLPLTSTALSEMYGEMNPPYTHTPLEMGVFIVIPLAD